MAENKLVKCNWLCLNIWKIFIYLVICPIPWWIARNTIALENLCYVSKVDHELHEHSRGRKCEYCTDYCSWNHALETQLFLLIQNDETNPLLDQTLPKYYDHRTEEIMLLCVATRYQSMVLVANWFSVILCCKIHTALLACSGTILTVYLESAVNRKSTV